MIDDTKEDENGDEIDVDDVLEELEQANGEPQELLKDEEIRHQLAVWKQNEIEHDYAYTDIVDEIEWKNVALPKSEFEKTVEQTEVETEDELEIADLNRDEFSGALNLKDMGEKKVANLVYKWIENNIHVRAIEEESVKKGDLLTYDEGIWKEEGGKKMICQTVNDLLGHHSSTGVTHQVMDQYLKVQPEVSVSTDELGLEPGYIAVENGLLNLNEGEVERELRPDDYAVTRIPHEYDPDANCPNWEKFINDSVENGKQKQVQEYVGYCLLRGEYPYAMAMLLLGGGSNGKSTFTNTVEKLLGSDNVMNASLQKLAGSRFSAYRLEGKLANINADIEGGKIKNTGMFKRMTGGDSFEIEQKYGDPYDHRNSAKLIFAANRIPEVDTEQDAFFRRWLLVDFPHKFTKEEGDGFPDADPELPEKLEEEMEGILNWAVEGYQRLVENGGRFTNQSSPEEVRERWGKYEDPIEMFIDERLVRDETKPGGTFTVEIYEEYERFARDKPFSTVGRKRLVREIKDRIDNPQHDKVRKNGEQKRGFKTVHIQKDT